MAWIPTDSHISKLAEHIWKTTGNTDDKANWFAAKAQVENFAAISEIINVYVEDIINYSYIYDDNYNGKIPNYVIFDDYDGNDDYLENQRLEMEYQQERFREEQEAEKEELERKQEPEQEEPEKEEPEKEELEIEQRKYVIYAKNYNRVSVSPFFA